MVGVIGAELDIDKFGAPEEAYTPDEAVRQVLGEMHKEGRLADYSAIFPLAVRIWMRVMHGVQTTGTQLECTISDIVQVLTGLVASDALSFVEIEPVAEPAAVVA